MNAIPREMVIPQNRGARENARRIVAAVKGSGKIAGLRRQNFVVIPMTLQRLADHGVPEDLCLPYDSEEQRALVQELAQLEVD
jgi:hypothetical protein